MARTHKRTERMVAAYLGGSRDWTARHDCSVPGRHNETWIIEVKSHAWRSGPSALWTLLDEARQQVETAMAAQGQSAENYCWPVVVYWPTRCAQDGSALLRRFRDLFCCEERD